MRHRWFAISLAGLMLTAPAYPTSPARAAEAAPERSLVFSVHQETLTRKRTMQETDVSQAYNGIGGARPGVMTSAGQGGGHTAGGDASRLDETVTVDIIEVSPEGVLGCNVRVEASGVRSAPVHAFIGSDGTVKWTTNEQGVDATLTFLLSLLATRLVPHDAAVGSSWNLGREKLHIASVKDDVARIQVEAAFGSSNSRGGEQTGWVDYVPRLFVPTRGELTVHGRVDLPSQSSEYEQRVALSLVSDSKQPKSK